LQYLAYLVVGRLFEILKGQVAFDDVTLRPVLSVNLLLTPWLLVPPRDAGRQGVHDVQLVASKGLVSLSHV
jgi:hypothetical protein